MRTRASELCYSCRNLSAGHGRTLEEIMSAANNLMNQSDDEFNSMIIAVMHDHLNYINDYGCSCWELVMGRIPPWMKGS